MAYFSSTHQYMVFEIFSGESFSSEFTITENGNPVDISDVTNMKFVVKRSFFHNGDTHNFTVTKKTPYTSGKFEVSYSSEQTKTLKSGRYVFDFFVDFPTETFGVYKTVKVAHGIIVVYPTTITTPYHPF